MPRQPGQPTSQEERAQWSFDKLISESKKLIRVDWGGQDPEDVVVDKLVTMGVDTNVAKQVSRHVAAICQRQVKGCRDRCSHNFDEMARRIRGT